MKEMSEVLAFLNKGIAAMDPVAPLLQQTPMLSMEYLFAIDVLSMLSMCYLCYLWNIYAIDKILYITNFVLWSGSEGS